MNPNNYSIINLPLAKLRAQWWGCFGDIDSGLWNFAVWSQAWLLLRLFREASSGNTGHAVCDIRAMVSPLERRPFSSGV